ncbi:hypothetical protein OPT61_g9455 [Boeremia exigua]|uniref:Uncharacterized protein n=1 Tax=Boeremia exigua TaxID=749465 RepID=A0ACC2HUC3_9PLEO|nr:hypothetical protein OPT61_g9455 [Boeremia exigua]
MPQVDVRDRRADCGLGSDRIQVSDGRGKRGPEHLGEPIGYERTETRRRRARVSEHTAVQGAYWRRRVSAGLAWDALAVE